MQSEERVHYEGVPPEEFFRRTGMGFETFLERVMESAQRARDHAYSPYSKFSVGAALLTRDAHVISGANVENASFGLTICAERGAVACAVGLGHRNFTAIAVSGRAGVTTAPCGACRQVLNEFNRDLVVVYTTPHGLVVTSVRHLLPDAFGPDELR
jgi:cytidine deaminase